MIKDEKMNSQKQIAKSLAIKALALAKEPNNQEIERCCWMVVHEFRHGVLPIEYDVREIDESLFLNVLNEAKKM